MYERFYELRERPFALSPDPEYLYPSRGHREALDYLRYGIETHAGFVVITGEIGSGKTTLVQTLLRRLDDQTTVGRIVNTILEPRELLETIMLDFGLPVDGRSKPVLLRDLAQYLVDQRLAGRLVLLVIDEAQNLSLAALEEIRMLSNLETEKSKLLQILLVGQPNLRDKLGSPELEQLRQRITVSYHLDPLDADETANYVNHRLRHASLGRPLQFPREVTDTIHARSRGVPRIINVISDAALVFGYAEERREIDLPLMNEVLEELETTGILPAPAQAKPVLAEAFVGAVEHAGSRASFDRAGAAAPAASGAGFPMRPLAPETTLEGRQPVKRVPSVGQVDAVDRATTAERARGIDAMERFDAIQSATLVAQAETAKRAIEQREGALRQRERELAEQRRVLAEEYRLLRARSTATAGPASAGVPQRMANVERAGHRPARFDTHATESLWSRIRRMMLGLERPAVGDN
jgi:putative secretion ATPase (PEP-CTERM system associated)